MAISYKKLWKMLIDKDMKKKIFASQQESVMLLWRSSARMRMLQRMCL